MKILGIKLWEKTQPEAEPAEMPPGDPLAPFERLERRGSGQRWEKTESNRPTFKTVDDFPLYEPDINGDGVAIIKGRSVDSATVSKKVMDNALKNISSEGQVNPYTVPIQLQNWYLSQSFIGYQACAIIAQHWLVNKACSMVGRDAVRKGWEVKSSSESELSVQASERLKQIDKEFNIKEHLVEAERFKNIFGIRVIIFDVRSDDPEYYSKPFNIDGVTKGSYKGIIQVDPYWMMPFLTSENTADPASQHFYDPEYWVISGQRYHRSHLIILRNDEPADILKPTYIYGGIPLTQQIYERIYAAERTANEAPLLAMSKRTTTLRTDVDKAIANERSFAERLMMWIKYRDNYAVKVLGQKEEMDQFDINLSDFDSIIMNQYQLVAAIAKVPSTKLLGTSPKGFNATGEFEMVSYHEELETCQQHDLTKILDRHYKILLKSEGVDVDVKVAWEPVGSLTATQLAEINDKRANTGKTLIDAGVISPDEERDRIKDDKNSGYNRLPEDAAEETPGMSPENMALLGKSAGEVLQGKADIEQAKADVVKIGGQFYSETGIMPEGAARGELAENPDKAPVEINMDDTDDESSHQVDVLTQLKEGLEGIADYYLKEGQDVDFDPQKDSRSVQPSTLPSVKGHVVNLRHNVGKMDAASLPKMKLHGMILGIENPRNSIRRGNSLDGEWAVKMPHHYGFIKGTKGADGDEVDCFVGPNLKSPKVFIVNQNDNYSGEFDEHKCMLGFDSAEEAKEAYQASFGNGWNGFDSIHELDVNSFKEWLKGDCSQAYGALNNPTNSPKQG